MLVELSRECFCLLRATTEKKIGKAGSTDSKNTQSSGHRDFPELQDGHGAGWRPPRTFTSEDNMIEKLTPREL